MEPLHFSFQASFFASLKTSIFAGSPRRSFSRMGVKGPASLCYAVAGFVFRFALNEAWWRRRELKSNEVGNFFDALYAVVRDPVVCDGVMLNDRFRSLDRVSHDHARNDVSSVPSCPVFEGGGGLANNGRKIIFRLPARWEGRRILLTLGRKHPKRLKRELGNTDAQSECPWLAPSEHVGSSPIFLTVYAPPSGHFGSALIYLERP